MNVGKVFINSILKSAHSVVHAPIFLLNDFGACTYVLRLEEYEYLCIAVIIIPHTCIVIHSVSKIRYLEIR